MWQLFYTIISHLLSLSEAASELISPAQPIIALVGDDVILPCHLEPAASVSSEAVLWTKPGLVPKYIFCHQNGHQRCIGQHPSYYMRTALFVDQLINGNVSLKIFRVTLFDAGEYFCILESMQKSATIHLTMAAASTPVLNIAEIDPNSGGVVLQCNSTGWYPEPEVFWLDGEGNLLSAGPPETVRGPDDLYTVSSRVTVEKRHSNSFTCRVTQKKTNQTRETQIQVPAELCIVPSSLLFWITIILSLIILVIFILKLKKYITKKRNQQRPSSTQRLRQSPPPPMARATEEPQSSPPMPQQQTPDSCSIATDTTDDLPSDGSCLSDQEVSENLLEGPESRRSNSVSSQ